MNNESSYVNEQDASYLSKHHLAIYMKDAVTQLLIYKGKNSNVNITKFFHEYFKVVLNGRHVIFRNYSFVSATPHNRISFINMVYKCLYNFYQQNNAVSLNECINLVQLLCHDFKADIINDAFRTTTAFEQTGESAHFPAFLLSLQFHFCCEHLISKIDVIFKREMDDKGSTREAIENALAEIETHAALKHELCQLLSKIPLQKLNKTTLWYSAAFSVNVNSYFGKIALTTDLNSKLTYLNAQLHEGETQQSLEVDKGQKGD